MYNNIGAARQEGRGDAIHNDNRVRQEAVLLMRYEPTPCSGNMDEEGQLHNMRRDKREKGRPRAITRESEEEGGDQEESPLPLPCAPRAFPFTVPGLNGDKGVDRDREAGVTVGQGEGLAPDIPLLLPGLACLDWL